MLTAADAMTTTVVTVRSETSIPEMANLLCDHPTSGVSVIEEERPAFCLAAVKAVEDHLSIVPAASSFF